MTAALQADTVEVALLEHLARAVLATPDADAAQLRLAGRVLAGESTRVRAAVELAGLVLASEQETKERTG